MSSRNGREEDSQLKSSSAICGMYELFMMAIMPALESEMSGVEGNKGF
jgi:hypothetical protein